MNLLPENIVNLSAITTDHVQATLIGNNDITLDVLRLDKIDSVISGNKWFKLQHYLNQALHSHQQRVITFGGAYSNHIIATACAASKASLLSTGIIRGERPAVLSQTLRAAAHWGMQLVYVSREVYQQKNDPAYIEQLLRQYPNSCLIPEGGAGATGIGGAAGIWQAVHQPAYTHVVCAMGTGTMMLGLLSGAQPFMQIIGIPVLKGVENWLSAHASPQQLQQASLVTGYHFGGYAKKTPALISFMNDWYRHTGIPSDFVYTGKLFFAVSDLIKNGYFKPGSRLLAIHSGGLQGNASLPAKTLVF